MGGSLSLAALLTLTIDIVSLAMIYESSEWIVRRVGLIGKSWFYLLLMAAKGIRDRAFFFWGAKYLHGQTQGA